MRFAILMALLVVSGCARDSDQPDNLVSTNTLKELPLGTASHSQTNETVAIDEGKAIEVARYVVATNETWSADSAIYSARSNVLGWLVLAIPEDLTLGSHRFIQLSEKGELIRYIQGF